MSARSFVVSAAIIVLSVYVIFSLGMQNWVYFLILPSLFCALLFARVARFPRSESLRGYAEPEKAKTYDI